MYLFVNPKQKNGYGSTVVYILIFCQLSCRKRPLISPGFIQGVLGELINKGRGGRSLYPDLKKRFKTSYILFEFTRILKLQNVVEIRILISMQARSRFLSRIYCLEEKCQVAEGHEVPRGVWGYVLRKFFEMNMCWDTICCILRDNFMKCYSGILFVNNTPCSLSNSVLRRGILTSRALTSSRLDDFFQYSYLYSVTITTFFFFFFWGGGTSTPQIP